MSIPREHVPAFPLNFLPGGQWERAGLTKREWYAGLAMQGILAASGNSDGEVQFEDQVVAENAVNMADALLSALEKQEPQHG